MKNPKLHDAIKALSKDLTKLLKDKLKTLSDIPTKIEEKIEIKNTSNASFFHITKVDLGRLFIKNEKEILKLDSAQSTISLLKKDTSINRYLGQLVGIEGSSRVRFTTEDCLRRFLVPLLEDLERKNGSVYCTVYLVEENKEFLKRYPQQPLPSHRGYEQLVIILDKQGKQSEAIALCDQAKKEGWSGDWDKRVDRYKTKLNM